MNLNEKLRKTLGGQTEGQAKILGSMAHQAPPLRIATDRQSSYSTKLSAVGLQRHVVVMYVCGME